jgi:Helix-turn-helix domain
VKPQSNQTLPSCKAESGEPNPAQGELDGIVCGLPKPPLPTAAEWENYTVPAGFECAGEVIAVRRNGSIKIDFDGQILEASGTTRGRLSVWLPDETKIEESGFDKFMSKVAAARHKAREYRRAVQRSEEAEERAQRALAEAAELRRRERAAGEQMASAGSSQDPRPRIRNQSISFRALQWAYAQDDLALTAKAVLVSFAIHCNERGYSWPGVDRIASTWRMHRDTVRRQIEVLLDRRLLRRTKKRRGATGQVKVYQLPKNTYESGTRCHPFENDGSEGKAPYKRYRSSPE